MHPVGCMFLSCFHRPFRPCARAIHTKSKQHAMQQAQRLTCVYCSCVMHNMLSSIACTQPFLHVHFPVAHNHRCDSQRCCPKPSYQLPAQQPVLSTSTWTGPCRSLQWPATWSPYVCTAATRCVSALLMPTQAASYLPLIHTNQHASRAPATCFLPITACSLMHAFLCNHAHDSNPEFACRLFQDCARHSCLSFVTARRARQSGHVLSSTVRPSAGQG